MIAKFLGQVPIILKSINWPYCDKAKEESKPWATIRSKELWRIGRGAKKAYVIPPTINSLGFMFALLMRLWLLKRSHFESESLIFHIKETLLDE